MGKVPVPKTPLSDAEVDNLLPAFQDGWTLAIYGLWVARAVERAHGIKTLQPLTERHGR